MSVEPISQVPDLLDPVGQLRLMLAEVDAHLPSLQGDMESLAVGRERLVQLRNDLQTLVRTVETMMIDAVGGQRKVETSVGIVEVKSAMKRSSWQSEQLLRHLLVKSWGGDMDVSPGYLIDLVMEVVTDCLPITGSLGWRITGLKEHGVDTSEWCAEEPGHKSIQVHGENPK